VILVTIMEARAGKGGGLGWRRRRRLRIIAPLVPGPEPMERAFKCPQCNGPLAPSRFGRSVVCSYCGATVQLDEASVSAAAYREAFRTWNSPASHGYTAWVSIGTGHWAPGGRLGHGEISDVYRAERARWPSERAVLKVLRDRSDLSVFDHEWEVLRELQRSEARGAEAIVSRVPQPIVYGDIEAGAWTGARAMLLRWAHGFVHTLEAVARAHPAGIAPRASVWVWRRVLETLSFLHASGMVHGAVIPPHLVVQAGEHGVRLVGFGHAERVGSRLRAVVKGFEAFYPSGVASGRDLLPTADLAMSARCVAALLGGEPATGGVPGSVPRPLAALVRQVAQADATRPPGESAWSLRERLGTLAKEVFGAPAFCPIPMPE
jgi:hypothetical protein